MKSHDNNPIFILKVLSHIHSHCPWNSETLSPAAKQSNQLCVSFKGLEMRQEKSEQQN